MGRFFCFIARLVIEIAVQSYCSLSTLLMSLPCGEKSNRVTSQLSTIFQSVLLYVRDRRETAAGHQFHDKVRDTNRSLQRCARDDSLSQSVRIIRL